MLPPMSNADEVLDQIDRVLADAVSDDAMRWTPDGVDVENLGPYGLWQIDLDEPALRLPHRRVGTVRIDAENWADVVARMRALQRMCAEIGVAYGRAFGKVIRALNAAFADLPPPVYRRTMHVEYRRRQLARRRRRRR
jgi:hypothetical protein